MILEVQIQGFGAIVTCTQCVQDHSEKEKKKLDISAPLTFIIVTRHIVGKWPGGCMGVLLKDGQASI